MRDIFLPLWGDCGTIYSRWSDQLAVCVNERQIAKRFINAILPFFFGFYAGECLLSQGGAVFFVCMWLQITLLIRLVWLISANSRPHMGA